jgi:hypothetical protein
MNRLLLALSRAVLSRAVLPCAALLIGLSSTAARAETIDGYNNFDLSTFTVTNPSTDVFDFSFSGAGQSGSGVFTTSAGVGGVYLVTGVSGTTDGSTITSLFAAGTYPFLLGGGDNELYYPTVVTPPNSGSSYFDIFGLSYALANGQDINLYYGQGETGDPEVYDLLTGLSSTPEPPSLLLLATAALGLLALPTLRRRPSPSALL